MAYSIRRFNDIGDQSVIDQLRAIAPMIAVSGNVDGYEQCGSPSEILIELVDCRIAIRHILYEGGNLTKDGRALLQETQPDLCIVGRTHRPNVEWFGKTLLFNNPGSAGPKRFSLPPGIGILKLGKGEIVTNNMVLEKVSVRATRSRQS